MKNFNYLRDNILCQIFKIILGISSKKMKKWLSSYKNTYNSNTNKDYI